MSLISLIKSFWKILSYLDKKRRDVAGTMYPSSLSFLF